ncbi:hypothetical protein JTE90_026772 [Oedothorax gibbosus]|uniref:Uncharacterized protein n=1 Tax=Oedothorax gibbosus TaxID=931172 RepID=A0AAV6TM47_9ARAC|nr:hypothetical protein JTE90_026772 [Oedothorax gibbosus]
MDFPNNDVSAKPGRRIDFFPKRGLRQFPKRRFTQPANPPPLHQPPGPCQSPQGQDFSHPDPPNYPNRDPTSKKNPSNFSHLMLSLRSNNASATYMNNFGDFPPIWSFVY